MRVVKRIDDEVIVGGTRFLADPGAPVVRGLKRSFEGGELSWAFTASKARGVAVSDSGNVLVTNLDTKAENVYLLDRDGRERWHLTPNEGLARLAAMAPGEAFYVLGVQEGMGRTSMHLLDDRGRTLGRLTTDGGLTAVAAGPQLAYAADDHGHVYAMDTSGVIRWTYRTDGPLTSLSAGPGSLTAGSKTGLVCGLDPSGQPSYLLQLKGEVTGLAQVPEGIVVVLGERRVVCVEKGGTLRWKYTPAHPVTDVASCADGRVFIRTDFDGVIALRAGEALWSYAPTRDTGRISCSPDGRWCAVSAKFEGVFLLRLDRVPEGPSEPVPRGAETPEALKKQGNEAFKRGEYMRAIGLYQRAIAIDPHYLPALNNLGGAYLQIGKVAKAKAIFEGILALDPGNEKARANLARCMERLNEPVFPDMAGQGEWEEFMDMDEGFPEFDTDRDEPGSGAKEGDKGPSGPPSVTGQGAGKRRKRQKVKRSRQ